MFEREVAEHAAPLPSKWIQTSPTQLDDVGGVSVCAAHSSWREDARK